MSTGGRWLSRVKDRYQVTLVDLPMNGRPTRILWHKRRFCCPDFACPKGSWSEVDTRIAFPRLLVTDRAGAYSGGFRTPVPIESVHPFRSFRTPREVVTLALA